MSVSADSGQLAILRLSSLESALSSAVVFHVVLVTLVVRLKKLRRKVYGAETSGRRRQEPSRRNTPSGSRLACHVPVLEFGKVGRTSRQLLAVAFDRMPSGCWEICR